MMFGFVSSFLGNGTVRWRRETNGRRSTVRVSPVRMSGSNDVPRPAVGKIVEVIRDGRLRIGVVADQAEGSFMVGIVNDEGKVEEPPKKVMEGEIVSLWWEEPEVISNGEVEAIVSEGKGIIRNSPHRALNLDPLYKEMQVLGKKESRSSFDIASYLFPSLVNGSRRAAARAAAALLVGNDKTRFKRGAPQKGFYALPKSVVDSRTRSDFIDQAKLVLAMNETERISFRWSRAHLKVLRAIELCAASETPPNKSLKPFLTELGFENTWNGALTALVSLGFWSKERLEMKLAKEHSEAMGDAPEPSTDVVNFSAMDWTFSEQVLGEARKAFNASWIRRHGYADGSVALWKDQRKIDHDIYCVDEFRTKFYDDAVSATVIDDTTTRIYVHVADVDSVVRSNGEMDRVACERGESMYLPRRPFHMIPPMAMEAASFSPVLYAEGLSIAMDVDNETGAVKSSEVFRSVLRPIIRVTYEQFNEAMTNKALALTKYPEGWVNDLEVIGKAASALMKNREESDKRQRDSDDNRRIAGIQIVGGKKPRVEVKDFQKSLAHKAIDELLSSSGEELRKFAKSKKCPLPERKGAELFARRCGTAPMRRYVDLAIQRQIKTVLINQQMPAGYRRMSELCTFLEKRHTEVQKTLDEYRKSALLTSLAEQCAAGDAAGAEGAVLDGKIILMRKKKMIVALLGTGGLTAVATLTEGIEGAFRGARVRAKIVNINLSNREIIAEIIAVSPTAGPSTRQTKQKPLLDQSL